MQSDDSRSQDSLSRLPPVFIASRSPRRAALTAWLVVSGALLLAAIAAGMSGGMNSIRAPVRSMAFGAFAYGFVAMLVMGIAATLAPRPTTSLDVFQMACWCLMAGCLGVKHGIPPRSYFTYINGFWPSYLDAVGTHAELGMLSGLIAILTATLLFRPPPIPKPGCCSGCGYDLTGNTSGVCPECGARTSTSRPPPTGSSDTA